MYENNPNAYGKEKDFVGDASAITLLTKIVHLDEIWLGSQMFSRFMIEKHENHAEQCSTATACLYQFAIDCKTILAHNSVCKNEVIHQRSTFIHALYGPEQHCPFNVGALFMITAHDIEQGLRDRQFLLHYQPKVSLITGKIIGAEALVRWSRDGALIAPSAFIALAERSSQIKAVTAQIFYHLANDLMVLNHSKELTVSFNVTAQDFEDPVLAERILASIAHFQMPPETLEVEITETQALHVDGECIQNVLLLCNAGVGLAMDDYGTGYSSIDTLSRWPFSTIKIDQGIISRMLGSEKNATIVRSAIRLGHELKINVVAEGVETPEQYQFLLESGCKTVQGYLISRPLPLEQFVTFLENRTHCPGVPVGLIHMAIVDHMQWRRQIASYAIRRANLPHDAPLRQADGYPPLSCHECSLGRWYFGPGQLFFDRPRFAALDASHRALHDVGYALVRQIQSGASLPEVEPLLDDLKVWSTQLVSHLEVLEDVGLAELYRLH